MNNNKNNIISNFKYIKRLKSFSNRYINKVVLIK